MTTIDSESLDMDTSSSTSPMQTGTSRDAPVRELGIGDFLAREAARLGSGSMDLTCRRLTTGYRWVVARWVVSHQALAYIKDFSEPDGSSVETTHP